MGPDSTEGLAEDSGPEEITDEEIEFMQAQDVKLSEENRHEHDCTNCQYVGSCAASLGPDLDPQQIDVYICEKDWQTTVVMRHSNDGPSYGSKSLTRLFTDEISIERYKRVRHMLRPHINIDFEPVESRLPTDLKPLS